MNSLIPTFEVGDKVRVTPRPNAEYVCPECGKPYSTVDDRSIVAKVLSVGQSRLMVNQCCGVILPVNEGIYRVEAEEPAEGYNPIGYVPYTWLTLIEEDES